MKYEIVEYITPGGCIPYHDWFQSLDAIAATKAVTATLRMEQGNLSNVKWFKGIGEYKINFGPGYRIYLAKEGDKLIILLGGGTKKGQQKDIKTALLLWDEYKRRKKSGG